MGQSISPSENYLFLNVMVNFVIVNQKLTGSALHTEKNQTILNVQMYGTCTFTCRKPHSIFFHWNNRCSTLLSAPGEPGLLTGILPQICPGSAGIFAGKRLAIPRGGGGGAWIQMTGALIVLTPSRHDWCVYWDDKSQNLSMVSNSQCYLDISRCHHTR